MQLSPSTEQAELKAAVRRFCDEQIDADRLQLWQREPRGVDDRTWRAVTDLGWFGLGLPLEAGGGGASLVEVACVLEEASRGLIPHAVVDAIRGGLALAGLDPRSPELVAISRGERAVTLALAEESTRDPARYLTRIESAGNVAVVAGEKWYVPDAERAELQIVAAREAGGLSLVLVAREASTRVPLRTFDGEGQAIVRYDRSPIVRRLSAAGAGRDALARLLRVQRALALAELVGTMSAALDMTVAYVKEREQFGQKIGVFQAVQHQVADMATAYTAARHLAWQAITQLANGSQNAFVLETAAAFVGQACKRVTLAAHHLHGGAGYVVEHPLHFHAERAQSLCIRHAPEKLALEQVATSLLGAVDERRE
jgi:alkylation response protein AidB-like acyl-CoA dehydrogenase